MTFVIVGGGLAGAKAAETLRDEGFDGPIVLVCAEAERPYERPPLSKGYMLGSDERDSAFVHPESWYPEHDVDLRLGTRATALDPAAHQVELDGGERLTYEKLLLTTGSTPRRLDVPGSDLDGVLYLRELPDADRIKGALGQGRRIAVVGVGITPVTALGEAAGLRIEDGIAVDAGLRTSAPDVYAAGDVAAAEHPRLGIRVRVEHWANALKGGPAAARSMLGQDVAYDELPFFFTDQYDLGMEYVGHAPPGGYDRVVTRGDVRGREFQAFWLRDGRSVAAMHVNLWDDGVAPLEELVRSGRVLDPERLADPS